MDEMEFRNKVLDFIRYNLTLEVRKAGGSYGSRSYTILSLKLEDEVISEVYLEEN